MPGFEYSRHKPKLAALKDKKLQARNASLAEILLESFWSHSGHLRLPIGDHIRKGNILKFLRNFQLSASSCF